MSDLKEMDERLIKAIHCDNVAFFRAIKAWPQSAEPFGGVFRRKWGPMVMAARYGAVRVGAELLRLGVSVNEQGAAGGDFPIHFCADAEQPAMMAFLLAAGADPNAVNHFGQTPLMRAAGAGALSVAKLLIAAGARVNARDSRGETPLMSVCEREGSDSTQRLVEFLLEKGANPNELDDLGQTPLFYALRGDTDLAALALLRAGADPTRQQESAAPSAMRRALKILSDTGSAADVPGCAAARAVAGWETSQLGKATGPGNASARSLRL